MARLGYWLVRLALELMAIALILLVLKILRHVIPVKLIGVDTIKSIQVALIFALPTFWLSRWKPWTIWITGPLLAFLLFVLILLAGGTFTPVLPVIFVLMAAIFVAAHLLGKSQHRNTT